MSIWNWIMIGFALCCAVGMVILEIYQHHLEKKNKNIEKCDE